MVCESLKACLPQYGYKKLEDEILLDDEYEIICIPSEYAELIIKCQVKYNPVGKIAKNTVWRSAFLLIRHSKYSAHTDCFLGPLGIIYILWGVGFFKQGIETNISYEL